MALLPFASGPNYNALNKHYTKWYNVLNYGAKGDNTTDDATSIQNAINAANTAGGGVVYFPGGYNYKINSSLVPKSNTILLGDGIGSHIITSTLNVSLFAFSASDTGNVRMSNLKLETGFTSGHIFDCSAGKVYYWYVDNCSIISVNPAKCIYYCPAGHPFVNNSMCNTYCYSYKASSAIETFYFVKDALTNAMNSNYFDNIILQLDTETAFPAIRLESTGNAEAAIYGNSFKNITLESAAGGYIKMLSTHSTFIENMWGYDQSAWQSGKSLIVASKSSATGAINNVGLTIINSGLNGSSGVPSGTAQPTIDLDSSCTNTTVMGFRNFPDVGVLNVGSSVNTNLYNVSSGTTINNISSSTILEQNGVVRAQYINGTDWGTTFAFMGS